MSKGSKIIIHALYNSQAVFTHLRQAVAQGTPFKYFKAVGGVGMLQAVLEESPDTIPIGRRTWAGEAVPDIDHDMSDTEIDGRAQIIMADAGEVLDANPGIIRIYELINEPSPATERGFYNLGRIMKRCVEIGRQRHPGILWGIGSFNAGEPEWSEMLAFLDSDVLVGAPEDVILCVHEAVFNDAGESDPSVPVDKGHGDLIPGAPGVPPGGGSLIGRVAYWNMAAGSDMVPVIVSEIVAGWNYGDPAGQAQRLIWADQLYSQMWYVLAHAPFTHAPTGGWVNQDYTNAYPYLLDYALEVKDRQNATRPVEDWRKQLWDHSIDVQVGRGIRLNPAAGLLRRGAARLLELCAEDPSITIPVTSEEEWTRPDLGRKSRFQVFENPVNPQATRAVHTAVVPAAGETWQFEEITANGEGSSAGLVDGFDAPVGTATERAGALWPGYWTDANPFGNYYRVRDGYYAYHTGADLNLNRPSWDLDRGKPVYATAHGVVAFAGERANWGKIVIVRHVTPQGAVYSRYSAVAGIQVAAGDTVRRGQQIAVVDRHNVDEAYHLHFDISPTEALASNPGDWPGLDRTRLERDYVAPRSFIEAFRPDRPSPPPPPSTGTALFGLHARADIGEMPAAEFALFARVRPEAIKVLNAHGPASVAQLARDHPGAPFLIRIFQKFDSQVITPSQMIGTAGDIQRTIDAIGLGHEIWVEIHNEPNLAVEGLWRTWQNGAEFNDWLLVVLEGLRQVLPSSIRFIYPGLSPGGNITGVRQDWLTFLEQSRAAVNACDALAVHSYWNDYDYPMAQALGIVDEAIRRFPGKPIWISEASNNKHAAGEEKGRQYIVYCLEVRKRPQVLGITYFISSASSGFPYEVWMDENGNSRGIAEVVGNRTI